MGRQHLTDKEILRQLPAAEARSQAAFATRMRAAKARVDPDRRLLTVTLTNGTLFSIPTSKIPGLQRASMSALTEVAVDAVGMGLHWEHLDVDVSVASLARVVFGDSNLLAAAGAAGGMARSSAKAQAARRNGLKGGRPRAKSGAGFARAGVKQLLGKLRLRRGTAAAERKKAASNASDRRSLAAAETR